MALDRHAYRPKPVPWRWSDGSETRTSTAAGVPGLSLPALPGPAPGTRRAEDDRAGLRRGVEQARTRRERGAAVVLGLRLDRGSHRRPRRSRYVGEAGAHASGRANALPALQHAEGRDGSARAFIASCPATEGDHRNAGRGRSSGRSPPHPFPGDGAAYWHGTVRPASTHETVGSTILASSAVSWRGLGDFRPARRAQKRTSPLTVPLRAACRRERFFPEQPRGRSGGEQGAPKEIGGRLPPPRR